jgi:SAM-dependent methyltransferase
LTEDDLFGAYALRVGSETITRDRLDSACEISFLERHLSIGLGTPFRILDIGSGYGRLGHRFVQAFENATVWCVDAVAEASFLCEYYLRVRKVEGRSEMVPLFELEDRLRDAKIDLAVNVHSFSECRKSAIAWWARLLRRHSVPYLMIVPNPDGTRLLSLEDDGSRADFVPVLEAEGYHCVVQEPKFAEEAVQRLGVSPTRYYLFRLFLD